MDGVTARRALGLGPEAGETEIKQAFRRLAKHAHPDVAGDAAGVTDAFMALQQAYHQALNTRPTGAEPIRGGGAPTHRVFSWLLSGTAVPSPRIDLTDTVRPCVVTEAGSVRFETILAQELARTA